MGGLGGWEWIILLVIIIVLFGPGRISKLSGEIGSSIRAFREGLKDKEAKKEEEEAKKEDK